MGLLYWRSSIPSRRRKLAMPLAAVNQAKESIRLYDQQSEEYDRPFRIEDHETAIQCLDFEGFLAFGLGLVRFIDKFDLAWKTKVHKGVVKYDKEIDDMIGTLYELWMHPCDRVMKRLKDFEGQGFQVSGADEFRRACQEVKGILTPDEEFFAGNDAFVRLQEQAIEANRRGETVELKEFSD
jgi:hypothetical protein